MASNTKNDTIISEVLNDETTISLLEVCQACHVPAEIVVEYVDYGLIEPVKRENTTLYFQSRSITRVMIAQRLKADLGVNNAGVALVIELLDELNELRQKISRYERTKPHE